MGISSYTCAKTNLPIIVRGEPIIQGVDLSDILFYPGRGEEPIPGTLGQYQTFHSKAGKIDLLETGYTRKIHNGDAKLALRAFLEPGDNFETLGHSHSDPGQGGLTYEDELLEGAVAAGGFKSFLGLQLAHSSDVPVDIAVGIDDEAVALYETFEREISAGWEEGTIELLPGAPEVGIPGSIGRFYNGTITPLNSECTAIAFRPYGHPRPRPEIFRFADGVFTYNPHDYARALALKQTLGKARTALFETEDGSASYRVTTYGNKLYTVEGVDYGLKAFKQIDHALNTIGFDLAFPAALRDAHPDANAFFDPWGNEDEMPDTATFVLPSFTPVPTP